MPNTVLKEQDGRYKTVRNPLNFNNEKCFFIHDLHPREIRFKRIHPRDGIYAQRTEEGILKTRFVNFYGLTPKDDFILVQFLCQQEIADVAVLDSVSAHVKLIQ